MHRALLINFKDLEDNPSHDREVLFLRNMVSQMFLMAQNVQLFGEITDIPNCDSKSD